MKKNLFRALSATLLLVLCLTGCKGGTPPQDTTAPTDTTAASQEETIMDTVTEAMTTPETDAVTETETLPATEPDTEPDTTPETQPEAEVEEGISRSVSKIQIIAGDSATEQYAAAELAEYLTRMGVELSEDCYTLTITLDPTMADDSYKMVVNRKNKYGTTITGGKRGVIYGAYRFLEEFGGARFFTPDLEVVPTDKLTIVTGVIDYEPVFVKRSFDWWPNRGSQDWMVKNGINDCGWYGAFDESVGGNWDSSVLSAHTKFNTSTFVYVALSSAFISSSSQSTGVSPKPFDGSFTRGSKLLEYKPIPAIIDKKTNTRIHRFKCCSFLPPSSNISPGAGRTTKPISPRNITNKSSQCPASIP